MSRRSRIAGFAARARSRLAPPAPAAGAPGLAALEAKVDAIAEDVARIRRSAFLAADGPSTPIRLKQLAVEDSARYVYETFPGVMVFTYRHETIRYAVERVDRDGVFLEFGVDRGGTITQTAKLRPDARIVGFDSFEGLPEDWGGSGLVRGRFDRGGALPDVPGNVELVRGWFDATIPGWKAANEGPIAFCHVDCDLYSSTVTVFTELEDRFEPGTILLFDEYFGYAGWRLGEHKAFHEMLERTGFGYEPLAVSHMALAVRLTRGGQPSA